jgi:TPR repeat protein
MKQAEAGNAKIQNTLGVMNGNGDGGPQDYSEAVKWWRKAVERGNSPSSAISW